MFKMDHDLDKMSLPQSSRNQELEVISKRVFEPLFDVERFILKSETTDNGIDYRCEIKYKGNVTGFCFNFQLKSKEKNEPLKNGTYSKSFELSNIQYLVNNTHPAFYGFYIVENDAFYFEYLDEFISNLKKNNPDWESQQNHTLNFSKKLDRQAVDEIYQIALDRGLLFRKINCSLINRLSQSDLTSNITIDLNDNVTDQNEIIKNVEKFGFELINQSNWNTVIELHNKTIHSSRFSAKYNMIVGLAYYYTGDYITSLKFLKEAINGKKELDLELQNHLIFIISSVKHLLFMIDKDEYDDIISKLPTDEHISFHIQIDMAVEDFKNKLGSTDIIQNEDFENSIKSIISNEKASIYIKLRAKSELLIYKGIIALMIYNKKICEINAFEGLLGVNLHYRELVNNELQSLFANINKEYTKLFDEIEQINNSFTYYYLFTYMQKYTFNKYSTFEILNVVNEPILINDYSNIFEGILKSIEACIEYFTNIGHIENQLFAKSIKYEVLNYLKKDELAESVLKNIEESVEFMDIKSLKSQVEFLKNGGTNHQMLQNLLDVEINTPKKKIEQMRLELIQLDENEKNIKIKKSDYHQITLFPMGDFYVPKINLKEFYKSFGIQNPKLKQQFENMFELGIVPVINSYVYPVKKEGPLEGNLENIGFESYQNMYNARKTFFKNKFFRVNSSK